MLILLRVSKWPLAKTAWDFQLWRLGNGCAGPSGLAELEQLHVKRELIPTLRSENLADISTECFSFHQGKSYEVDQWAQLKTWYWSSNEMLGGSGNKDRAWVYRAFRACRGRTATCGVKQWAQSTSLQLRLAAHGPATCVCMWHLRDSMWMRIF